MLKKFSSLVLLGALLLSLSPATLAFGSLPFRDVPESHWAYSSVQYVYENDLMTGTSATTFSPEKTFSRAMFVTILGRLEGIDPDSYHYDSSFRDVPANAWHAPYVNWASENGIVGGYGNGRFGPSDLITREQFCAIVCRYLNASGQELAVPSDWVYFDDQDDISDYAIDSVQAMVSCGLISPIGDSFYPQRSLTRAEIAVLLTRLHSGLSEGTLPVYPIYPDPVDPDPTDPDPVYPVDPDPVYPVDPDPVTPTPAQYLMQVCPPYETDLGYYQANGSVIDGSNVFRMAGKQYTNGFMMDISSPSLGAEALFNLDGAYQHMEFDLGHVDGTTGNTLSLMIYLDGEMVLQQEFPADSLPIHLSLDLDSARQMKIVARGETSSWWGSHYGLAEIVVE